jgi:hypothetical protein
MSDELKRHLRSKAIWTRGLTMLLFAVFWMVAEAVLLLVAVFQFGSTLLTGATNDNAARFGAALARYLFQIAQFVTYNSEERPFPFAPWPEPDSPAAARR